MKKKIKWRWEWTIFKKLFLILLVSFLFINVLSVYLDYLNTTNTVMNNIDHFIDASNMENLAKSYNKQYLEFNDEFLKEVASLDNSAHGYVNEWSSLIGESFVVDKDYNIKQYQNDDYQLSFYVDYVDDYYLLDLLYELHFKDYNLSQDQIDVLDAIIENHNKDKTDINVEYSIDMSTIGEDVVDLSYISIDGIVIKDGDRSLLQSTYLSTYYSENYSYMTLDYLGSIEGIDFNTSIYLNTKEYKELILNRLTSDIKNWIPVDYENDLLYSQQYSFKQGDNIYYYSFVPLLNSKVDYDKLYDEIHTDVTSDEYVEYDESTIDGYIVIYMCNVNAIPRIIDDVIDNKKIVYICSFMITLIVCFIISYVFTKRIKIINRETLRLANNEFDIHLKEKPKDELGTLSSSINSMSQQLKQTIDHLNDEIEQVKKLESVRMEFITNFTHEIKTPLGIINGYIELIEESKDDSKKEEYLKAIEQETNRINELVLAMLDFSKLNSGKVELKRELVNLDELVSSSIDIQISLIKKKNIHIDIDGKDVMVDVDPFEFSIVLKNFLNNAIKHTDINNTIYISYSEEMFSIENVGEHLTDEQMESIWDTYVSSDRQGTGLGLAICKSILDLHGFGYGVENSEKGVCFKIYFLK